MTHDEALEPVCAPGALGDDTWREMCAHEIKRVLRASV